VVFLKGDKEKGRQCSFELVLYPGNKDFRYP
jgi:hypothetical protein